MYQTSCTSFFLSMQRPHDAKATMSVLTEYTGGIFQLLLMFSSLSHRTSCLYYARSCYILSCSYSSHCVTVLSSQTASNFFVYLLYMANKYDSKFKSHYKLAWKWPACIPQPFLLRSQMLEDCFITLDDNNFHRLTELLGFKDGRLSLSALQAKYDGKKEEPQTEHLDQRRQQSYQFCMAGFSMFK